PQSPRTRPRRFGWDRRREAETASRGGAAGESRPRRIRSTRTRVSGAPRRSTLARPRGATARRGGPRRVLRQEGREGLARAPRLARGAPERRPEGARGPRAPARLRGRGAPRRRARVRPRGGGPAVPPPAALVR